MPAAPSAQRPVARKGAASLVVDRRSAVAGRALSFVVEGLAPGEQFTAVLDDGVVASGPHVAGSDGRATGVIALPEAVSGGTHELRVYGASRRPSVRFAIAADADLVASQDSAPSAARSARDGEVAATVFAVAAGVVFMVALVVALGRQVRSRRARA